MNNPNPRPETLRFDDNRVYCIDKPFILTQGNLLVEGMPYLYSEGSHIIAVNIVDISVVDEMLYLMLEDLNNSRIFNASWNLEHHGDYYLWTIADLPSIMNL
jgi:hypothetical protein